MALREIEAHCDGCGHIFTGVPRRSFLGLQLLTCPACGSELRYPLTAGYRAFYWVCAVSMSLSFVGSLLMYQRLTLPGLVGGAIIAGLVKDRIIRRELADAAEARASIGSGPPDHTLPGG